MVEANTERFAQEAALEMPRSFPAWCGLQERLVGEVSLWGALGLLLWDRGGLALGRPRYYGQVLSSSRVCTPRFLVAYLLRTCCVQGRWDGLGAGAPVDTMWAWVRPHKLPLQLSGTICAQVTNARLMPLLGSSLPP